MNTLNEMKLQWQQMDADNFFVQCVQGDSQNMMGRMDEIRAAMIDIVVHFRCEKSIWRNDITFKASSVVAILIVTIFRQYERLCFGSVG